MHPCTMARCAGWAAAAWERVTLHEGGLNACQRLPRCTQPLPDHHHHCCRRCAQAAGSANHRYTVQPVHRGKSGLPHSTSTVHPRIAPSLEHAYMYTWTCALPYLGGGTTHNSRLGRRLLLQCVHRLKTSSIRFCRSRVPKEHAASGYRYGHPAMTHSPLLINRREGRATFLLERAPGSIWDADRG